MGKYKTQTFWFPTNYLHGISKVFHIPYYFGYVLYKMKIGRAIIFNDTYCIDLNNDV